MIYWELFKEFFHIGLFSYGGGYATLPFLYHIAENKGWYSVDQLTNMIAVSSVTPGPVGVNVATFAGFMTSGLLGSLIATTAVILPSFFLILIIYKLLDKFRTNRYVRAIIYMLKPTSCGLLAAVGIEMFIQDINMIGMLLLVGLFIAKKKKKRSPMFYLGVSALAGIVAGWFHLID